MRFLDLRGQAKMRHRFFLNQRALRRLLNLLYLVILLESGVAMANNFNQQSFEQMIDFVDSQQTFWQSRSKNLLDVERYLMRFYMPNNHSTIYMRRLLASSGLLNYNHFIINPQDFSEHTLNSRGLFNQTKMQVNHIQDYLEHLPKIEMTSYQVYTIPAEFVSSFQEGLGLYEQGFMQSLGNLHTLLRRHQSAETKQSVIMEIRSQSGRMMAHVHPSQEPIVFFPRGTYYEVKSRTWHEASQAWLVRIQEITQSEARALPEVHHLFNNGLVAFDCDG